MRTEVRLTDLDQRLVRERNLLTIQHRALFNLLGWNTNSADMAISGELDPQTTTRVPDLKTALTIAWRQRADYLTA